MVRPDPVPAEFDVHDGKLYRKKPIDAVAQLHQAAGHLQGLITVYRELDPENWDRKQQEIIEQLQQVWERIASAMQRVGVQR